MHIQPQPPKMGHIGFAPLTDLTLANYMSHRNHLKSTDASFTAIGKLQFQLMFQYR